MHNILQQAIRDCAEYPVSYCKYITANDTGDTGGHQSGFHIHKGSWSLMFSEEGVKGENKDKFVTIKWQDDFKTSGRFIYYGKGTRNEYRLTRFGKGFPYISSSNVGNLLVLIKVADDFYLGYVLSRDEDIEQFIYEFGISPTNVNGLIPSIDKPSFEDNLQNEINNYISSIDEDFPSTRDIAIETKRIAERLLLMNDGLIRNNPDKAILELTNLEYEVFKAFEQDRYNDFLLQPFQSVDGLIRTANTILNRRKSRAGKSLEHHLASIFDVHSLNYEMHCRTEDNKKPDFIFPDIITYFQEAVGSDKLVFLGAKTTCKDRWRQIISEADRIPNKHLFTLQQGISSNQLTEMQAANVKLVVPQSHISSFPTAHRDKLMSLSSFVEFVKGTQQI